MVPRDRNALQNWFALLAVVVVAASPLAVAGAAGAPTGPVVGATAGAPTPDAPAFRQNKLTAARGDVTSVAIDLGNHTAATLRVGPDDTASNLTAEIARQDANGDGRIEVRLNTYSLGTDVDGAVTTRGEDAAEIHESTSLDDPLRASNYSLTLLIGNETVDESTLVLEPASLDGLALRVANRSVSGRFSSPAAVRAAVENGTFVERERLPLSGTLLVELKASGLSRLVASQPGPNATARFLALLEEPGFSLTIRENESTINLEEEGNEFLPTASGTTVVADPTNDTYYVLLDLARLPRRTYTVPGGTAQVEAGDVFDVNVTVTPESRVFERRQSVESRVTVRRGEVTVDVPTAVASGPNQTVEATTTLPENASVTLVLDRRGRPFRTSRTVRVGESGHVVATFDLTSRTVGEELDLTIQIGGTADSLVLYFERNAVRVTERGTPTATPTATATATPSPRMPTGTATSATPTGDNPDPIPGFGTVGALVAVAAAVAITALGRSQ